MKSWKSFIKEQLTKPYMQLILNKVQEARQTTNVFPTEQEMFAAFRDLPINDTKVVILGQDPYPTKGFAHGLAFSAQAQVKQCPKSLQNIFKALYNDLGITRTQTDLSDWANQGVLLLNTILSVNENEPLSHATFGYEQLMQHVFMQLQQTKHVVYLLWGRNAQSYTPYINAEENLVITSSHPSPLSAYHSFLTTKHFSQANDYLIKHKKGLIKW
ncbi:uracil-DNA glycosylase [Ureaplasma miroungigenitalium]|uniref:Uracil-DNA glycosylase n=1 Tax=Ureaplasma miroungigenitalium TaxID=1042321 RepID=A0ABT3BMI6_9BACT|nr:uracil-DNA glycosylase [Ureaplasma miroungigenitalium]MCV3728441.1 uracil-DNA glycosylase [Ureaplasma miroungigenitalium]MCV3734228.1 uracil-DNA glycosylase [Ureaplasma miroungigenitalium]